MHQLRLDRFMTLWGHALSSPCAAADRLHFANQSVAKTTGSPTSPAASCFVMCSGMDNSINVWRRRCTAASTYGARAHGGLGAWKAGAEPQGEKPEGAQAQDGWMERKEQA